MEQDIEVYKIIFKETGKIKKFLIIQVRMLSIYQLLAHIICIFFTEKALIITDCAGFLNLILNTQNLHLLLGFTTPFRY